ncbi:MAG: electron transfer flavoprotein subunit beta/FixA family protein [bacterium]|nr:electron transfer flavoprotein subunit beta/FixA family protein [bacterium]
MKILVPIKRTHDPYSKIKLKPDGSGIDTSNIKFVINPFDEIAVEEALRKKEKHGGEVVILSIGTQEAVEQIRTALAMGADRGILVDTAGKTLDQDSIARIMVKIIGEEKPDLVIMGKQAIDDDSNQVGQLLSEYLNWPQATFASKVDIQDKKATVVREVDGGLETVEVDLPAIITTDLRLNQPRYASLPGIMKAKQKPLKVVKLDELGVDITPKIVVEKLETPPERKAGIKVKDVDELIAKLKEMKALPF